MRIDLTLGRNENERTNPSSTSLEILKEPYFGSTPSWERQTRRSDSLATFDSNRVSYSEGKWYVEGLTTDHPEKVYHTLSTLGFSIIESKMHRDYAFNSQAEAELNAKLRARGVKI